METHVFEGIGIAASLITAFISSFFAVRILSGVLTHRYHSCASKDDMTPFMALLKWRLRNGYLITRHLSAFLLRYKSVCADTEEFEQTCSKHNIFVSRESVLSVILAAAVAIVGLVGLLTKSPIAAAAVLICLLVALHLYAASLREKRSAAVREALPDALESMIACFDAGYTLMQTFQQIAQDTTGTLSDIFGRCSHVLETGGNAKQALAELRQGKNAQDLAFISIALDIQHQSGGSMHHILACASDSLKNELALRRSLRVQTAQAKLSARIVFMMPFILIALFSLVSPGFLMPFFSSVAGYALLALAIIMQIAGVILVNKALSVDGVA